MDKCPYCGVPNLGFPVSPKVNGIILDVAIPGYKCGTKGDDRSQTCYEIQIANLKELLGEVREVLEFAKVGLFHYVPEDCWSTGPLTGNPIDDLIACPGCRSLALIDVLLAKLTEMEVLGG